MKLKTFLLKKGFVAVRLQVNVVNHFILNATLNDEPITLLVDTGASATVLDLAAARHFGLDTILDEVTGSGIGAASIDIYKMNVRSFKIAALELNDVEWRAIDLSAALESLREHGADADISGVLGADVLFAREAIIDYAHHTLYLK